MASFPRSFDSHSANGQKAVAAAAERNKEPILAVLKEYLAGGSSSSASADGNTKGGTTDGQTAGVFLEVASGTGQHCAHFAAALPHLTFQPTEYAEEDMGSIAAWTQELPNVRPPLRLDASQPDSWPVEDASCRAVFVANMTHIAPWAATQGLLRGAGRVLQPAGQLFVYGLFSIDGKPTTESNVAFDAALRSRNPEWGYRDVADVAAGAAAAGMRLVERRDMPANNFMLVFKKGG